MNTYRFNRLMPALLLLALGCGGAVEVEETQVEPEQPTGTASSPLMGNVSYGSDCTAGMKSFLEQSMMYGRATSTTVAFNQCVSRAVLALPGASIGPYRKCLKDPFYSSPLSTQLAQVMQITHSPNDVSIQCTGAGDGLARAGIGTYGMANPEALAFSEWLARVQGQLSLPLCDATHVLPNCRESAAPWPHSQAAAVIWHEAMHQQGYVHGADDQAAAKVACGYASSTDDQWHFQRNTMPYIVGHCIGDVIARSGTQCGALDTCGPNALKLVDSYDGTTCSCVPDPRPPALGVINIKNFPPTVANRVTVGERMGGWAYSSADLIGPVGDFNGDGRKDFVERSAWGIGLIGRDGMLSRLTSLAMTAWGTAVGGWTLQSSDQILKVGDFNGDGRDDLLVKGSAGYAILTRSGGSLVALNAYPYGTSIGGWKLGPSDVIPVVADFNHDGRADFLIQSTWGFGIIGRNASGALTLLSSYPAGSLISGGWRVGANDRFPAVGDVNGDGFADVVVQSSWGMAVLTRTVSGTLSTLNIYASGARLGGWSFSAADAVRLMADVDGDGRTELVITSAWGLGILARNSSGGLQDISMAPQGSLPGGWNFTQTNGLFGPADFNGDGRQDLLVTSPWGFGVLTREPAGLLRTLFISRYTDLIGPWLNTANGMTGFGDFDGDRAADLLLRR